MMKGMFARLLVTLVLMTHYSVGFAANAQTQVFTSPETQTTLIELYTSEGCSSCPPADHWLSHWKNDPQLWKTVIPLAFHVDYWNYLGWTDRFAKSAYSARQERYASRGYARSVYTPGMFTNGREWRSWFRGRQLKSSSHTAGTLNVTLGPQELSADFDPAQAINRPLRLNIAVEGFDIQSSIRSGENQGKVLNHDFVVLTLQTLDENSAHRWQIPRNDLVLSQPHARAIVVWVTSDDDPTPIQATGGWLSTE